MKHITRWEDNYATVANDPTFLMGSGVAFDRRRIIARLVIPKQDNNDIACSVHQLSTWCYTIHNIDNSSLAKFQNGFSTLEEAKTACEIMLQELGYEFVSNERAEKIRMLL